MSGGAAADAIVAGTGPDDAREAWPVRVAIAVALTAALVRLVPLQWLHPLNWDELEFFTATTWVGEGRVPFRDFWEHHSPLSWMLFAPVTWLTQSPGVDAVIVMRWAQIPLWVATFVVTCAWMKGLGVNRFARWSAIAFILCSSLFMIPAIEYRVEALGCFCLMSGLLLAQRQRWFAAGVVFCLAGLANLRLGPLLVVAVIGILVKERKRAVPVVTGGLAALLVAVGLAAATGSLAPMIRQVLFENTAEKFAPAVEGAFAHRFLVPFGIRVMASDRLFEWAAVDFGGVVLVAGGLAATVLAFRRRDDLRLLAVIQLVNLLFIARMKFIYNYHLVTTAVLVVPLLAALLARIRARRAVVVLLLVAGSVNAFASIFRGKELDRAYQDRIMREAHARTSPDDVVWSGTRWTLRREPAYRFWFLPELARILVTRGMAEPYVPTRAPGVLIVDHNAQLWITGAQRELARLFIRHYVPVWRELWIPGMNVRLQAGHRFDWAVPRDGAYRVYASPELAKHPWFRDPLLVASFKREEASRFTLTLPAPGHPGIEWRVGNRVLPPGEVLHLRRGERLTAISHAPVSLGVILLPTGDRVLFRQPPAGVTLEGETTRVTHVPRIGARIP